MRPGWILSLLVVGTVIRADELLDRFEKDSKRCTDAAKKVHGDSDPNAGINHYLNCLARKTDEEVGTRKKS